MNCVLFGEMVKVFSLQKKNFFKNTGKVRDFLSVRKSGNHDLQFKHVLIRKILHKTIVDYFGGGKIIKSEKKNLSIVKYFSFLGQSQVVPPVNRR